ncbi:MAG: hypothetical protein N2D54_03305 [Chloroflexota bacterium]
MKNKTLLLAILSFGLFLTACRPNVSPGGGDLVTPNSEFVPAPQIQPSVPPPAEAQPPQTHLIDITTTPTAVVAKIDIVRVLYSWGADTIQLVEDFFALYPFTYFLDGVPLPQENIQTANIQTIGDLDQDGDDDFAAGIMYVFEGLSPGTYQISLNSPITDAITDGLDLDNDGQLDSFSGPWDYTLTLQVTE